MKNDKPTISVDVFVFKKNKILLGKRVDSHTKQLTYAPPGGHLEIGETLRQCAIRETMEETGLTIKLEDVVTIHENNKGGKHYVIICFEANWIKGEPIITEPENYKGWDWYSLDKLPKPLFGNNRLAIKNFKKKIIADKRKQL